MLSGGDPQAVAEERQVRELFAPYGEWAGLAAVHMDAI
jgi:3-methyladenine DNA glycosylase/8-oxoguanine DNA glycosylase